MGVQKAKAQLSRCVGGQLRQSLRGHPVGSGCWPGACQGSGSQEARCGAGLRVAAARLAQAQRIQRLGHALCRRQLTHAHQHETLEHQRFNTGHALARRQQLVQRGNRPFWLATQGCLDALGIPG